MKKFIKLLPYLAIFLGYGMANAITNPTNLNGKEKLTNSTNSILPNLRNNFDVLLTNTQDPVLSWTEQNGAYSGWTSGYAINADNLGNIYIAGFTTKGISGQKQNGIYDYFIAKYDQGGNLIWTKQVGASGGMTMAYGISTDQSGNVYVTGKTTVGISGQKQNGIDDYFVAKYNPSGNLIWAKQVGASSGDTEAWGVSVNNSGNLYVAGFTTKGISGQKQNGTYDYFIAKYDINGNLIWVRQVGTFGGTTEGSSISTDSNGNAYVAGFTSTGISGQKQNGIDDYFITKYDLNGNIVWTRQVGASGGVTSANGVSTDNSGNIYVVGETVVGISGQTENGTYDYFVAQYDQYGNLIWTKQVGATGGWTDAIDVSTDSNGNIYVVGGTNVGISGQTQNGGNDYFIAQYNQLGALLWTKQIGRSRGYTFGNGISTDNSGNIYVTGDTTVSISSQPQTGSHDYFIAKYVHY